MRRHAQRPVPGKEQRPARLHHGLDANDFAAMLDRQDHACMICGRGPRGMAWAVDHDHELAKLHPHADNVGCLKCIRGILCQTCNTALGNFMDDPALLERAAEYIRMAKAAHG
jgi:hypothetical protein